MVKYEIKVILIFAYIKYTLYICNVITNKDGETHRINCTILC